jgi:hypothetical protein
MTLNNPTLLTGNTSATDSASYNTASVTPGSGDRILVLIVSGKASNLAAPPTSVSQGAAGGMGSLTKVGEQAVPNNNLVVTAWSGVGTGVAGAININHGANVMDNCAWQVVSVTSTVYTPIVQQVDLLQNGAAATTGATLSPGAAAGAMNIGVLGYNAGSANTPTVGTGFTIIGSRLTQTSPTIQLMSEYDNTAPISNTAAFTTPAANGQAYLAIELRDGTPPPSGPALTVWNGSVEVPATLTVWDGAAEIPATLELAP